MQLYRLVQHGLGDAAPTKFYVRNADITRRIRLRGVWSQLAFQTDRHRAGGLPSEHHMRVKHHFSIILFVSVVGALGLAGTVGALLGGLEDAAHDFGTASDQRQQVRHIVAEGGALAEAVSGLRLSGRPSCPR